jgi:predicted nucleotidyltransferase
MLRLIAACQPERIYLFGSVARGDADQDGDYDLLVVVSDDAPPERRRSRLAYEALTPPRTCWCAPLLSSKTAAR